MATSNFRSSPRPVSASPRPLRPPPATPPDPHRENLARTTRRNSPVLRRRSRRRPDHWTRNLQPGRPRYRHRSPGPSRIKTLSQLSVQSGEIPQTAVGSCRTIRCRLLRYPPNRPRDPNPHRDPNQDRDPDPNPHRDPNQDPNQDRHRHRDPNPGPSQDLHRDRNQDLHRAPTNRAPTNRARTNRAPINPARAISQTSSLDDRTDSAGRQPVGKRSGQIAVRQFLQHLLDHSDGVGR